MPQRRRISPSLEADGPVPLGSQKAHHQRSDKALKQSRTDAGGFAVSVRPRKRRSKSDPIGRAPLLVMANRMKREEDVKDRTAATLCLCRLQVHGGTVPLENVRTYP
jgi:hypothetical protein